MWISNFNEKNVLFRFQNNFYFPKSINIHAFERLILITAGTIDFLLWAQRSFFVFFFFPQSYKISLTERKKNILT